MLYGGDGLLGSVPWVTDGLLGLVNLPLKHLKRTGFKMTGVPGVCFLFECCLHDKVCTPQPLPRAEQPMTCFSSAESAWAGEEGELKGTKKNLQSLPQVSWVYCNKREQMLVQAQIPLSCSYRHRSLSRGSDREAEGCSSWICNLKYSCLSSFALPGHWDQVGFNCTEHS